MTEEKEYTIIKVIITSITLIIATLIILLFVAVSKVEAQTQPPNSNATYIPLINMELYNNNTFSGNPICNANSCLGYEGTIRSYTSRHRVTDNPLMVQNETYTIWYKAIAEIPYAVNVNQDMISAEMYVYSNNNWIRVTPDALETSNITNLDSTHIQYEWSFQVRSTVYVDTAQFNVKNKDNIGWVKEIQESDFYIRNDSLTNDTQKVIDGIDAQTNSINNNNNKNTEKVIQTEESIWNEYKEEFGYGEADIEESEKDRSGINSANSKEDSITYGYGVDNIYLDFNPPSEPYFFIWDLISEYIGIVTGLMSIILCINTLRLIAQILGRRA